MGSARLARRERLHLRAHRVEKINNLQPTTPLDILPALPEGVTASDPDDAFLLALDVVNEVYHQVTGDRHPDLLRDGRIGCAHIVTLIACVGSS